MSQRSEHSHDRIKSVLWLTMVAFRQLGELAKVNMYMRKGRPRQWNETMQTVVDFLQRSVGRRAGIRSLQTTTGIRDAFCRPLIESLQRWAFEIRRTPAEMQAKLEDMEPIGMSAAFLPGLESSC